MASVNGTFVPLYETGCKAVYRQERYWLPGAETHYKARSASISSDRMRMKIRASSDTRYGATMTLPIICLMTFACSRNQRGCAGLRLTAKRAELSALEMAYWLAFSPVVDRITGVIERKAGKAAKGIGLTL